MDERIRKSNDIYFFGPFFFFALSNILCMITIFYKKPQSNVFTYVISYFYFIHVSLSSISSKKLKVIMHTTSFNGWRNFHSGISASWIYLSCIKIKETGEDLSLLSCMILGFLPSMLFFIVNYINLLKTVKNDGLTTEIMTYTRDVLLTYHNNYTMTKDGASSAEMALNKMKGIIKGGIHPKFQKSQFGSKNVIITSILYVLNSAFSITFFKNMFFERVLSCICTSIMSFQTILIVTTYVPEIDNVSNNLSPMPYAISLGSMIISVVCSWVIYYLTMNPFVTAASAFHFVDAISHSAYKMGIVADVMHASLSLVISIMISI